MLCLLNMVVCWMHHCPVPIHTNVGHVNILHSPKYRQYAAAVV